MSAVPAPASAAAPAAPTPFDSAAGPAAAPLSAQERLARSRAAITGWLAAEEAERAAPRAGGGGLPRWLERLRGHPLAALAVDALTDRWRDHPLATSLRVAEVAAAETVAPLVRRHPAVLLGASALAGALLIRARPWRWLLRPALLGGIASQLVSQLVDRLVAAPPARPRQPTDRRPPGS